MGMAAIQQQRPSEPVAPAGGNVENRQPPSGPPPQAANGGEQSQPPGKIDSLSSEMLNLLLVAQEEASA
jgi:hypothetical protein